MKKELFLQTIACNNQTGATPFWELEFHLWEKYTKLPFFIGESFTKLSNAKREAAIKRNAEIMAEVSEKLGFSAVTAPGRYWELAPGKPAFFWLPDGYRERQIKSMVEIMGDDIAVVVNVGGIMSIPEADRYVDFSIQMFEDPAGVERISKQLLEESKNEIDKYGELGIVAFLTASDIADNTGPYFPPEQFQQFILPFLAEWSDFINRNRGYSIMHTDGNIMMYSDDIANTGLNAIQAIDPLSGMDIVHLKQQLADKLCLCGNLDCSIVIMESEEAIFQKTLNLLNSMSSHNGYSFGMSNVLELSTPAENFNACAKAYNVYTNRLNKK